LQERILLTVQKEHVPGCRLLGNAVSGKNGRGENGPSHMGESLAGLPDNRPVLICARGYRRQECCLYAIQRLRQAPGAAL
jgi:rhodanese-related sulfurtransferase